MAAYQLFDPLRTFWGERGQLVAGGELRFYEAGTTTPADVFGDPNLTVNNGQIVGLDSAGRPVNPIWGDSAYFVELFDADGVKQGEIDNLSPPASGTSGLPPFEDGKYLTNDGLQALWAHIAALPDMDGHNGRVLSTDGTTAIWIPKPADGAAGAPAQNAVGTATSMRVGNTMLIVGTGAFPASGGQQSNVSVNFPTPFASLAGVVIQMDGASHFLHAKVTTKTAAGFSAAADSNIINHVISTSQGFTYFALGTVT